MNISNNIEEYTFEKGYKNYNNNLKKLDKTKSQIDLVKKEIGEYEYKMNYLKSLFTSNQTKLDEHKKEIKKWNF